MEHEKTILQNEVNDANQRVEDAERNTELAADDKSRVAKECENMIVQWRRKLSDYESSMHKKDVVVEALNEQLEGACGVCVVSFEHHVFCFLNPEHNSASPLGSTSLCRWKKKIRKKSS